ncbi:DnaA regulatory inactivator Hda, partial [Psychromonas arctica]
IGETVAYIPLQDYRSMTLDNFDNMENITLVCIDNVDALAGDKKWEKALFYFYNRWLYNKDNRVPGANLVI